MARPEVHNTPFGERLAQTRKALGFHERKTFAALFDLKADTLGTYERGVSHPDYMLLAQYHEQFNVSLTWLITGKGTMFETPAKQSTVSHLSPTKLARAALAIDAAARKRKKRLKVDEAAILAANIYNELQEKLADLDDEQIAEQVLTVLAERALAA